MGTQSPRRRPTAGDWAPGTEPARLLLPPPRRSCGCCRDRPRAPARLRTPRVHAPVPPAAPRGTRAAHARRLPALPRPANNAAPAPPRGQPAPKMAAPQALSRPRRRLLLARPRHGRLAPQISAVFSEIRSISLRLILLRAASKLQARSSAPPHCQKAARCLLHLPTAAEGQSARPLSSTP